VFCGPTDATVAVASDVALAGPTAFVAVTTTRIVEPASAEVSWYDWLPAPAMSLHGEPLTSQRRHWYVNVIGGVPFQVPFEAVSVWPSCGVPSIVGGAVFDGGCGGGATAEVTAETAVADPTALVAVTATAIPSPTSASVGVYD
jgi:hypothetical protein